MITADGTTTTTMMTDTIAIADEQARARPSMPKPAA